MTQDTRGKILRCAEKLFVSNGFEGTSLRAITADAGVNLAAVNYHFGSKESLLEEVLRARIAPVNAERLRRLDALEAEFGADAVSLEQYLDAFIRPAVELFRGVSRHRTIGVIAMLFTDHVRPSFLNEVFSEIAERFGRLRGQLPQLSSAEFGWRFHFMIGSMIHAAAHGIERMDPRLGSHGDEDFVRMLVVWAAAGFRAEPVLSSGATPTPEEASS